MTLTCSGAFWVRREWLFTAQRVKYFKNTHKKEYWKRCFKIIQEPLRWVFLITFRGLQTNPQRSSTKLKSLFFFFFPAFRGLSYTLKQARCPLIISCAREPARQFHNSNLWHLHLLWGCPTKQTPTPTRGNKHCSGRHHLALFFFLGDHR